MTLSGNSVNRRYKALRYRCPTCNAAGGEPCRGPGTVPMKGVHRSRDLVYNENQQALADLGDKLGEAIGL